MTQGETIALLAFQGVGMLAGYAMAAMRTPLLPRVITRARGDDNAFAGPPSLEALIDLAEDVLEPHGVALYVENPATGAFELRGRRPHTLGHLPVLAQARGIVPMVRRRQALVSLKGTACSRDALGYYDSEVPVRQAVAAPVWVGSAFAGVLVVDTLRPQGFGGRDLRIINRLGHQLGGALQLAEVMQALSRDQAHKERFYQASRAFALARTVDQVARVAVDMARRISELDFAALIVQTEGDDPCMRVAAAEWHAIHAGPVASHWVGRACSPGCVVEKVIKTGHGEAVQSTTAADLCGGDPVSLSFGHVFPLNWKNSTVGALVVGHSTATPLSPEALDLVTVLADHAAVAIANALLFERLEHMATTDPLTGLANQRQLHATFDASLARAERYGRQLSLIFMDIDHFKAVNDRYGHPVGDAVLRQVAAILQRTARRTDLVARYGGEEFAILMEETGRHGALQMAERIRRAVEAEALASEGGSVHCTLSLGVATFPKDASDKTHLIACADQALYQAKRSGRNQTVVFAGPAARGESGASNRV